MIHDSILRPEQAIKQNPEAVCPDEIIRSLGLMSVEYLGFDNALHIGQIVVAQEVMADVDAFFRMSLELKFPIEKVVPAAAAHYAWDDEKLMADNASSGFNFRLIAGSDRPSLHARGRAFDINPRQNPYIRYENDKPVVKPHGSCWNPEKPGTLHADHPLVKLMEGHGWEWGGHWTSDTGRTDYQHFQKLG